MRAVGPCGGRPGAGGGRWAGRGGGGGGGGGRGWCVEAPVGWVDGQRAGPATGVPTKTEQGDLWQLLGAGQGDYPRIIVAPASQIDLFPTIPELFNLVDKYQCPGLVLADLLISEGTASIEPGDLNFNPRIERGELIF